MCFAVTANRNPYLLIIFDLYFVWVSVLFDFENAFVYIMSFHWAIIILLWLLNNWVCVCVFCLYSTCSLESRQTLFGLPFSCGCSSISIATTAQHLWLRTRSTTSALLFTFMPIRRILSLSVSLPPFSRSLSLLPTHSIISRCCCRHCVVVFTVLKTVFPQGDFVSVFQTLRVWFGFSCYYLSLSDANYFVWWISERRVEKKASHILTIRWRCSNHTI